MTAAAVMLATGLSVANLADANLSAARSQPLTQDFGSKGEPGRLPGSLLRPPPPAPAPRAVPGVRRPAVFDGLRGLQVDAAPEFARIINGKLTPPGSFPSMVVLVHRGDEPQDDQPFCGGTVIAPEWVLTAAHCVVDNSNRAYLASSIYIREGSKQLAGGRSVAVREIVAHPDYWKHASYSYFHVVSDIALLHLDSPSSVPPQVLLPAGMRADLIRDGTAATIVGFGRTNVGDDGAMSPVLQQALVSIVGRDRCDQIYTDMIFRHNICVGAPQRNRGQCNGDSGGPLFMRGPGGALVQVGIVSWGPSGCTPERFGVYTSVADFESFIQAYVPDAVFADPNATGGAIGAAAGAQEDQPLDQTAQLSLDVQPAGTVHAGTQLHVRVESSLAGTLVVLNIDAAGKVTQLFPNRMNGGTGGGSPPAVQIAPGEPVLIPAPGDRYALTVGPPFGDSRIVAVVTPPNARLIELLGENGTLQPVADAQRFISRIAEQVAAGRQGDRAPAAPGLLRHVEVTGARPAAPVAERRFRVEP